MTIAVDSHSEAILRVGIAGAGKFGRFHASKIEALKDVELICVFDRDPIEAKLFAQEMGIAVATTLQTMLSSVDAVMITCPASGHAELAHQALASGCHVFVEKPIALNLEDADALICAANDRELVLQVGHQERYVADALGVFDLPEMPIKVECRRCMPKTGRGEDVSVVMDLMIHDLDLLAQISKGANPVTSLDWNHHNNNNNVNAVFSFQDCNLEASCVVSRRSSVRERSIRLIYATGFIYIDFLTRELINTTNFKLKASLQDTVCKKSAIADPLAFGARDFVGAIRNKRQPIVTGEAARRALAWALAVEHNLTKIPAQMMNSDTPNQNGVNR